MKTLLYIGHSYHKKTKSNVFLRDMLEERYKITDFYFDPYKDDFSVFNKLQGEKFDTLILWQIMPSLELLSNSISFENIVFFPMYDAVSSLDYDSWTPYRDVKIFNFSKTLDEKLKKWGFHTHYLQYFIEPMDYVEESNNGVFFWQRLTAININTVAKLFENLSVDIHLHKSIDPSQEFCQPTKKQEEKFNITYSSWFDTKKKLQDCIQLKTYYVAPRHTEGIGMSFLEAMAMGKVVIANNEPTMNEYIIDGYNGYLFDKENPQPLVYKDIEQVRKNTYEYVKKGYKEWESRKYEILEFIESPQRENAIEHVEKKKSKFFSKIKVYDTGRGVLITKYRILGISVLYKKSTTQNKKVYLFKVIPLFRKKTTERNVKYYLFNFLPIAKFQKK